MATDDSAGYKKICVLCRQEFTGSITICPNDEGMLIPVPVGGHKDPFVGTVLASRYEILSVAGKGGMGIVYKARHRLIDRVVAVKMLRADLAYDEQSLMRFQIEARAASRLHHPNVVAVHDCGITDTSQPFLVMDYIEGESLADVIKKGGCLDFRRAVPIFIQACNALEHAHRQQVIHRDVKPSNITLLQTEGQSDFVKVLDFGIAKLITIQEGSLPVTRTGEVFGSPTYMSPEQCMGSELDARTDIYSLGATMYETLLACLPIQGKTIIDTISKQVNEPPRPFKIARPNVSIPEPIEAIVMRALEKDKNRRFQTMLEMKEALEAAMEGKTAYRSSSPAAPGAVSPQSEFGTIDIRKEIMEREIPVSHIQVDRMQAKGKAARLLSGDKEDAPAIEVGRLKASSQKTSLPPIVPILIALALALVVGALAWFFLLNPATPPAANKGVNQTNQRNVGPKIHHK